MGTGTGTCTGTGTSRSTYTVSGLTAAGGVSAVKIEFTVNNVSPSVSSFSFMKIVFGNYNVSIYNLPVQWN